MGNINGNCGPSKDEVENLRKMQTFDRAVKKTELLMAKIGMPPLSNAIYCKSSEINLIDHVKDRQCEIGFDNDSLKIYAGECIEFYNSLLTNRNVKTMSETNFDVFLNAGRLWQSLNTHYSQCTFPPNEVALKTTQHVLEIWHLVLINVYRFYYHGHVNSNHFLKKSSPLAITMNKKPIEVSEPTRIPIVLPLPLQPEKVDLSKESVEIF
jgi:hypothetical protein